MHKVTAIVLLVTVTLAYNGSAQSQTGTNLSRHAAKIKQKVTALRTGAGVAVKLKSGTDLHGTIQRIEDSTFTISDSVQNQGVTVAYEDVKKVSKYDQGVIVGPPNPHKSLIIGACVLGGLIIFIAVVVSNHKF